MRLGLVGGQRAHSRDLAILKAVYAAKTRTCIGPPMLVAFRNDDGQLYRFAALDGPGQELDLRRRLEALGIRSSADGQDVLTVLGSMQ